MCNTVRVLFLIYYGLLLCNFPTKKIARINGPTRHVLIHNHSYRIAAWHRTRHRIREIWKKYEYIIHINQVPTFHQNKTKPSTWAHVEGDSYDHRWIPSQRVSQMESVPCHDVSCKRAPDQTIHYFYIDPSTILNQTKHNDLMVQLRNRSRVSVTWFCTLSPASFVSCSVWELNLNIIDAILTTRRDKVPSVLTAKEWSELWHSDYCDMK